MRKKRYFDDSQSSHWDQFLLSFNRNARQRYVSIRMN